jgi:hypothetical protein
MAKLARGNSGRISALVAYLKTWRFEGALCGERGDAFVFCPPRWRRDTEILCFAMAGHTKRDQHAADMREAAACETDAHYTILKRLRPDLQSPDLTLGQAISVLRPAPALRFTSSAARSWRRLTCTSRRQPDRADGSLNIRFRSSTVCRTYSRDTVETTYRRSVLFEIHPDLMGRRPAIATEFPTGHA